MKKTIAERFQAWLKADQRKNDLMLVRAVLAAAFCAWMAEGFEVYSVGVSQRTVGYLAVTFFVYTMMNLGQKK